MVEGRPQRYLTWFSVVWHLSFSLVAGNTPSAKYNKLSEQARRLIAGESQCAMFCGGKKCKYCTADNWKPEQMAISGLYSEWWACKERERTCSKYWLRNSVQRVSGEGEGTCVRWWLRDCTLNCKGSRTLEWYHSQATGVTMSVLPWPATVLRTHERLCSSDSQSMMQMNLDPLPHTCHPGPFPSLQRSAWLKYPRRYLFYIWLCMEVHILDDFWLLIQVNSSRQF